MGVYLSSQNKKSMNKAEALNRLTSLENEAKALRVIIETPEPLKNVFEIKNFQSVCEADGTTEDDFYAGCVDLTFDEIAYRKLKMIVRVLNEGWVPDWDNANERKWRPWFWMNKPGFRLSVVNHDVFSISTVGSRLCLKSEELAQHAVKYFLDVYKDFFNE